MILTVVAVVYFRRHHEAADRARFLRETGLVLMGVVMGFIALFIVGETLTDPGGWRGVGLIALWLVPMVGALALAWWRPDRAVVVLGGVVGAILAVSVWYAVDADSWNSFEDDHGPVRTIAAFAASAPLALLGWKRPRAAGLLLVVVTVVPVVLTTIGLAFVSWEDLSSVALSVIGMPGLIAGLLYLASDRLERNRPAPSAEDDPAVPSGVGPDPAGV